MLSLSPAKILVVLVVALIVLGPEKLPGVARQLGAVWGEIRKLRTRLESEVREVLPDLPPTHELTQAVRSPLAFLDRLADDHERAQAGTPLSSSSATAGSVNGASADGTRSPPPTPAAGAPALHSGPVPGSDSAPSLSDDPSMN